MNLMTEMYAKHGEVFTVPLLHKRMTFIFGPHASPHFFNAVDDKMSQTEVYDFNTPTFGPGVVYDVDQRVRSEQFRFVAEALRTAKLRTYVPAFQAEAEEYFGRWGESGVVNLVDVFGELIILTASRTLLGEGGARAGGACCAVFSKERERVFVCVCVSSRAGRAGVASEAWPLSQPAS